MATSRPRRAASCRRTASAESAECWFRNGVGAQMTALRTFMTLLRERRKLSAQQATAQRHALPGCQRKGQHSPSIETICASPTPFAQHKGCPGRAPGKGARSGICTLSSQKVARSHCSRLRTLGIACWNTAQEEPRNCPGQGWCLGPGPRCMWAKKREPKAEDAQYLQAQCVDRELLERRRTCFAGMH
jgi:hypothetical protein